MKVCFLLSYTPNPRMKKRIGVVKGYHTTSLIYWKRTATHIWGNADNDIESIEINTLSNNGNPLARIIPTIKFAFQALYNLKRIQPDCLYVENLDMLLIAWLYCLGKKHEKKIIYEIADIHSLLIDHQEKLIKRFIQKILRHIDVRLCKHINLLVITSDKFYEIYYSKFVPKDKVIFMPNMPDLNVFKNYKRKTGGKFTVGFIGAIRYKEQMKMLIQVAEKCELRVLFAGAGLDSEIQSLCYNNEKVEYYGEYTYNSEIAQLYGKVDCIFSVYDANLFNVRVALPNKLYESIYCGLPIIVAKGTYLAELVEKLGVGVAVSHTDVTDLEQALKGLSSNKAYYDALVQACYRHRKMINPDIYNDKLRLAIDRILV